MSRLTETILDVIYAAARRMPILIASVQNARH